MCYLLSPIVCPPSPLAECSCLDPYHPHPAPFLMCNCLWSGRRASLSLSLVGCCPLYRSSLAPCTHSEVEPGCPCRWQRLVAVAATHERTEGWGAISAAEQAFETKLTISSVLLYVHRSVRIFRGGEPRTATSPRLSHTPDLLKKKKKKKKKKKERLTTALRSV